VAMLLKERCIDFKPQDDYLQEVRLRGGDQELMTALKNAKVTKPIKIDSTLQAWVAKTAAHQGSCSDPPLDYRILTPFL